MMKRIFCILTALLVLAVATTSVVSSQDLKKINTPVMTHLAPLSKPASETASADTSSSTIQSPIDHYSVFLYGRDQIGGNLVAYIHCYYQGKNVATCEFYKDGTALPENRYQGGRIGLTYHWSHFDAVLDLLRNESPVFAAFIESTKVGYIATGTSTSSHGREPVGDGENTVY